MPARDLYHEQAKAALANSGWLVTHDPLRLHWGRRDLFVDLGAEQLIAAQRGLDRIAVEVKSFTGVSVMTQLEHALGQYALYEEILKQTDPNRRLYLAVTELVYLEVFEDPVGQLVLASGRLRLMVFDPEREVILQWIPT